MAGWHRFGGYSDSRAEGLAALKRLRAADKPRHRSQQAYYRLAKGYQGYFIEFRLKQSEKEAEREHRRTLRRR